MFKSETQVTPLPRVRVLITHPGDEWPRHATISQALYDKIVALKRAAKPQGQEPLVLT